MPELAPENQGLYFQPSYDRAFEAQLERDLISVLEKLQGYCNENTYFIRSAEGKLIRKVKPVTDIEAFMEIRRVFDSGRMLLSGYKEEVQAVNEIDIYLKFISKQTALDTDATIENLEGLSAMVGKHLKQNQQFKDKTHAKFVWDAEVKKN
jgi:hypothetical protein